MDADLWFENYRDMLADKMPDSCYYHLPSCQTKKSVYVTYAKETNKDSVYNLQISVLANVEGEI